MLWYAFLLACGSSTDNFAVGTSLGISNKQPLKHSSNVIISICNASGAYISAAGGHLLGELAPKYATLFAAIIFAYLATDELLSWRKSGSSESSSSTLTIKSSSIKDVMRIAIPMTLNNLAGGAAGGASGIDANTSFIMALVASFCMMKMGHTAGIYLTTSFETRNIDTHVASGMIFACLALMQFVQLV